MSWYVQPVIGDVSTLLMRPIFMALPSAEHPSMHAACGTSADELKDPDGFVRAEQRARAWRELEVRTDSTIALRIAESVPVGAFGLVEYLCRSAPTLGASLEQWVRFLNLIDGSMTLDAGALSPEETAVTVTKDEAPAPLAHELCFAVMARNARALAVDAPKIVRVEFKHARPAAPYASWFQAPVRFGADHNRFVLTTSSLASSLVSADANLARMLERYADDALASRLPLESVEGRLRDTLRARLRHGEATLASIAPRMGASARSLQRALRAEGTTFNDVRDEVRRELAERYLRESLCIAEVSFLLGFSEPSAFFRAFKRWTGTTPRAFRESH